MGADLSSCCSSAVESKETQLDITPVPQDSQFKTSVQYDAQRSAAFWKRLEAGIAVHLILQDRTKLVCDVKLDKEENSLIISCEISGQTKVRSIPTKDIKAVLHTRDQLRRVESSAGINETDTCAAIHLAASGNCIPLFFARPDDKLYFVQVVEECMAKAR